ncbi:MAG: ISNCY family transposase [Candidatus Limnocylindrales bacterium]
MDTRETIALDARAQQRLQVLNHVLAGELTAEQAGLILHLSIRTVRRLLAAYRSDGAAGLIHGNRGRAPAHRTPDDVRDRLVGLATTTYAGANRAHLAELLAEREGLVIAERTLRRVLTEAGLAPPRARRPSRHRSRRERMPREGMLVQTDGSRHQWFGPDEPYATLVGVVDDATSRLVGATFRAAEDAAGYLTAFTQMTTAFGLPGAIYSDRHGIFTADPNRPPTLAEQLAGKRSLTQVGRALDQAGITWIGARSAQGKGRVERTWGTLQDRLVVELRLETITTIAAANAFLPTYVARHNERFMVPAADPTPAWRAWPDGTTAEAVFAFCYPRRVARDATISWPGGPLVLPRRADGRSWAGRSIILQERLDGSLWVSHDGICLPVAPAPRDPVTLRARDLSRRAEDREDIELTALRSDLPVDRPRVAPPIDHPWRRYPATRRR